MSVAVIDRAHELPGQEAHRLEVHPVGVCLQDLEEALLDELEDEVELPLAPKCLLQLHNVLVAKHPEDLHLPQCGLAHHDNNHDHYDHNDDHNHNNHNNHDHHDHHN